MSKKAERRQRLTENFWLKKYRPNGDISKPNFSARNWINHMKNPKINNTQTKEPTS